MGRRRITLRELKAMGAQVEVTGGDSVAREKPGTPERDFQNTLMKYAKLRGWRRAHFRPARVIRRGKETWETPIDGDAKGFPDLIFLRGPRLVVIECKAGDNEPTDHQYEWLHAFKATGVEVYVWWPRDLDNAMAILE